MGVDFGFGVDVGVVCGKEARMVILVNVKSSVTVVVDFVLLSRVAIVSEERRRR